MQVLAQSHCFRHVAKLRMHFEYLLDPVMKARVLLSQVFPGHGDPRCAFFAQHNVDRRCPKSTRQKRRDGHHTGNIRLSEPRWPCAEKDWSLTPNSDVHTKRPLAF